MKYYVRYNNQTLGPFAEDQIINFLQQGRFNDSVRFSADLVRWYAAWEISSFRGIRLVQALASNTVVRVPRDMSLRAHKSATKDHSVLYFMGFCLLAILGFGTMIYAINKDDSELDDIGMSENDPIIFTADSLPAAYQKKQRAIGLVTLTFQGQTGGFMTIPIGTAFAIGKNKICNKCTCGLRRKKWI